MAEDKTISAANPTSYPAWLNVDLFQKALRNVGDDKSKVTGLTVNLATAAGDNYSSTLYRVKAELADGGDVRFLVKATIPATEGAWAASDMFRRENEMMGDAFPRMQALLDKAAPGRFPPFGARHYLFGQEGDYTFIVMEDLAPSGFKMADRKRGLGLRHALLAIRSLARYHAASHALLRKDPELYKTFDNFWRRPREVTSAMIEGGVQCVANVCRTWPGYEGYADDLDKLKPTIMATFTEYNDPSPDGYNVISHCDFWLNNIMFCYEDGLPTDNRVVDLQCCHVTSPVLDLLYFLYTSLSENVSAEYEDLLLREYHTTLLETSDLLGTKAPSMEEFLADLNVHGSYSLVGATCVLPLAKTTKAPDLLALVNGDLSGFEFMFHTPDMTCWYRRLLPKFKSRGWLSV